MRGHIALVSAVCAAAVLSGTRVASQSPLGAYTLTPVTYGMQLKTPDGRVASLGPVTIRPGSPLTLRYRVVVHDGPSPTAVVDKLAAEFRGTK